ncbi:YqgE/AlgH family protein [Pseudomonas sp. S36]|nr:YqgE/AlgH family protein [Pseudomonas sp. S36]
MPSTLSASLPGATLSPMKTLTPSYLKHQFLIAMPHMADPNFAQTLTYIVEHNAHGAMGLVVNRPQELNLADILEQLRPDEVPAASTLQVPIYQGGPVQTDRGFVLHTSECTYQATVELEGVSLSTSQDVLFAIAEGVGPQKSLITLGYAGWEAGQLEAELADNAWLNCPFDPEIIFGLASDLRLEAAAASLGINLHLLTSQAGHA